MKFHGIFPAVLVPFTEEGKIDFRVWERYIDFLISKGVHGLFLLGTNGEGSLSFASSMTSSKVLKRKRNF